MYDYFRAASGGVYRLSYEELLKIAQNMRLVDEKSKYGVDNEFQGMDELDFKKIFDDTKTCGQDEIEVKIARGRRGRQNSKNHLYRYEFSEFLLRLAQFRYMDTFTN